MLLFGACYNVHRAIKPIVKRSFFHDECNFSLTIDRQGANRSDAKSSCDVVMMYPKKLHHVKISSGDVLMKQLQINVFFPFCIGLYWPEDRFPSSQFKPFKY